VVTEVGAAVTGVRPGDHVLLGCGLRTGTGAVLNETRLAPGQSIAVAYVLEGNAVLKAFLPRLIDFWRDGRFPFDRGDPHLSHGRHRHRRAGSLSGVTIKLVLLS
jgi:aryl-alcohol dehydrogenase